MSHYSDGLFKEMLWGQPARTVRIYQEQKQSSPERVYHETATPVSFRKMSMVQERIKQILKESPLKPTIDLKIDLNATNSIGRGQTFDPTRSASHRNPSIYHSTARRGSLCDQPELSTAKGLLKLSEIVDYRSRMVNDAKGIYDNSFLHQSTFAITGPSTT